MSVAVSPENPPRKIHFIFPPGLWAIFFSALAWAIIFAVIPPSRQNFPLGDDWAFARGAIWFSQSQGVHYSNWASMPQLGQWIWSWPFLHLINLPHVALRISVIVLSWLGLAAFYDLLRREKVSEAISAFAACVLALAPLIFISQGTYMTDVPAIAFGLLALCFFSRALENKNPRWILAATLAAIFAVVTRQTMLAVPLVAAFLIWRERKIRWQPIWIFSVAAPIAICLGVAWWFSRRTDVLPMSPHFYWKESLVRPFIALHLCGLVVLPILFLIFRPRNWRVFLISFAVILLATVYFRFCGEFPYGGLFPYCTGMLSLEGTYSDGLVVGGRAILLTAPVRTALTVLGGIGAAGILTALVEIFRARKFFSALLLFSALQLFILLTLPSVTDRYLEVLFPGAIFLMALRAEVFRWPAGIAILILCGLISMALMHDWLSWNSARWELGRQALASKNIRPTDIEGGFEWNGWFATKNLDQPSVSTPGNQDAVHLSLALPFTRFFFPQVTGQFALAFTPPPNSLIVTQLDYSLWLPPARKEFFFVQSTQAVMAQ